MGRRPGELLQLNPNDNQGIRYLLLACFLVLERNDEVEELPEPPEDTQDITASWA